MLRILLGLIGAGFVAALLASFGADLSTYFSAPPEETAEHEFHKDPKALALSSDGPFGKYDRKQLQRGFQVYKEVCAACHGLNLVAFHDLHSLG